MSGKTDSQHIPLEKLAEVLFKCELISHLQLEDITKVLEVLFDVCGQIEGKITVEKTGITREGPIDAIMEKHTHGSIH